MLTKITLFIGLGLFIASFTQAQDYKRPTGSEFSIGIEGALPLNGWDIGDGKGTKYSKLGGGVTLKYAYNFNETVAATFQTGYIYFPGKKVFFNNGEDGSLKIDLGQIPFKAGVRFSMGPFYIEPQLGISSINGKITSTYPNEPTPTSTSSSSTAFTYSIGVGAMAAKNFDYTLHYEAMSKDGTSGYLALRFSYSIPFSKK